MFSTYPMDIEEQEDGSFLVEFPDVQGAVTDGDTAEEAMEMAKDCLVAAMIGYIKLRQDIPAPGCVAGHSVTLSPLVAAKLLLYQVMRNQKVTNVELGRRLGMSEVSIRRMLDLDYRSHIGPIADALAVLGKRVAVVAEDVAA